METRGQQVSTFNKVTDLAENTCTTNATLNLLSLNVCGLISKLKYDIFIETVCKNKIICLSEIKANCEDCVSIKNLAMDHDFVTYCKPCAKALRKYCGLCTLFESDITIYVREIPSTLEIVQWFTINKRFIWHG